MSSTSFCPALATKTCVCAVRGRWEQLQLHSCTPPAAPTHRARVTTDRNKASPIGSPPLCVATSRCGRWSLPRTTTCSSLCSFCPCSSTSIAFQHGQRRSRREGATGSEASLPGSQEKVGGLNQHGGDDVGCAGFSAILSAVSAASEAARTHHNFHRPRGLLSAHRAHPLLLVLAVACDGVALSGFVRFVKACVSMRVSSQLTAVVVPSRELPLCCRRLTRTRQMPSPCV